MIKQYKIIECIEILRKEYEENLNTRSGKQDFQLLLLSLGYLKQLKVFLDDPSEERDKKLRRMFEWIQVQ